MSSNQPPVLPTPKSANTTGQLSPALSQTGSVAAGDTHGQRRSGGSGSFGAGSASRASPSPRSTQAARRQHKPSKRFRLTDEDVIAESTAMRNTSSRKGQTSITHLMNFSLPPRPSPHHAGYRYHAGNSRHSRRAPTWGGGSGYHAGDKARYIHANYRFIVDPRGDYRPQSVDADIHLDWNQVLQILASAQSQDASCPICLGHPVAPRMAKCGHIFCLPCLIRYMHSEDDSKPVPEKKARWKKCPICWDHIYISDTRPVRWYVGQEGEPPREGADVVLRLVMREAGSTLALPRDGADSLGKDEDIPWHFAAEVMDYARIMKGSEEYMMGQYDSYIEELETQRKEDELMFGEDNVEWMRKAVRMIHEGKEKLEGIGNPPSLPMKPPEPKPKRPPIVFHASGDQTPEIYLVQNASKSGQSLSTVQTPELGSGATTPLYTEPSASDTKQQAQAGLGQASLDGRPEESQPPPMSPRSGSFPLFRNKSHHENNTPSEYYFYQALLHYYLSPLDIRILKAAFGSFAAFPATILPRVERVSTGHIVDDDLRKRTKYLAHLPYGCEVGFLECDWTDIVSAEILEKFNPEIERRRKRNHDKETREEKARLRAEKEEDKQFAAARQKRTLLPQEEKFSADDFQPLVAPPDAAGAASDGDNAGTSPPWPARRGQGFDSLASPSTSPSASRTVWGTAAVTPASPIFQPPSTSDEPVDDGWLQGWEKDLLQEDLLAQVQAVSLGESSKPSGVGGKKKKAKKITLMSTNVRRGA